jgi:hypothetical protein
MVIDMVIDLIRIAGRARAAGTAGATACISPSDNL